ncbi:thioesterase II family protein [Amycolatopsis sp. VS8301801F10]|uniref:thioesterase II family protein n=1 Tax=Amycolatopsis sp. VS8301801F10 TaxID=2652442 RepID=UPI0038FC9462
MHTRKQQARERLVVENLYLWRARRRGFRHRLVCFPHAGGGANAYASWVGKLPPEIELAAVQLPGRQNRIDEAPADAVDPLVHAIVESLRPVTDAPFSFFGHSSGSLLAFEVARELQARGGPSPRRLFLSAQSSPDVVREGPKLHSLPESEFRAAILSLGGFDAELAEDADAVAELLPPVLADFRLWENHRVARVPLLQMPILALTGQSDWRAPLSTVEGWRAYTTASFSSQMYPGGHFYLIDDSNDVPGFVGRTLLEPEART